jgi:hypothetical protein
MIVHQYFHDGDEKYFEKGSSPLSFDEGGYRQFLYAVCTWFVPPSTFPTLQLFLQVAEDCFPLISCHIKKFYCCRKHIQYRLNYEKHKSSFFLSVDYCKIIDPDSTLITLHGLITPTLSITTETGSNRVIPAPSFPTYRNVFHYFLSLL